MINIGTVAKAMFFFCVCIFSRNMHPSITMYTFTHSFTCITERISYKFISLSTLYYFLCIRVCARTCVLEFSLIQVHHKIFIYRLVFQAHVRHMHSSNAVCACQMCTFVCVCLSLRVCLFACVSLHMHACMCVCLCVCVCVCVLLWTHGSKDIGIQRYCPLTYIYQKKD